MNDGKGDTLKIKTVLKIFEQITQKQAYNISLLADIRVLVSKC